MAKLKLDSQYFDTAQEVVTEWHRLQRDNRTNEEDAQLLSEFYSSLPMADSNNAAGVQEQGKIMNLGLGADALREQITSLEGLVARQGNHVEIKVRTNSPDVDKKAGEFITQHLNEAMQLSVEYSQIFWPGVVGGLMVSSKVFCIQQPAQGWCPQVITNLYTPRGCKPINKSLAYCMRARTFNLIELKAMQKAAGSDGKLVDEKVLERLIKIVKNNPTNPTSTQSPERLGDGNKGPDQLREAGLHTSYGQVAGIEVFEARFEDDGQVCISSTIIFEQLDTPVKDVGEKPSPPQPAAGGKDRASSDDAGPVILYHDKDAYEAANHWLHVILMDTLVGPSKTLDDAQSPAAAQFDRDWLAEVLMRDSVEGDRIRMLPRYRRTAAADPAAVQEFSIHRSHEVPGGVEEFQFGANSGGLSTPLNILLRKSTEAKGGNYSGEDQLRVQALRLEQQAQNLLSIRAERLYAFLDHILNEIVRRFCVMPLTPGCEGYCEIKWFRDRMEEAGIPYKELAEQKDGNFLFLKVRAVRALRNGDMSSMDEFFNSLLDKAGYFAPESRQKILHKWVYLTSGDKSMADDLVMFQKDFLDPSQVMAELEWDTIVRRGWLGETLDVAPQDIHPYHVASHKKDLNAMVAKGKMVPWNVADAAGFASGVDHTLMHIGIMNEDPSAKDQAAADWAELQQINESAKPLLEALNQQQEAQQQQLSPELQLKHMHKLMDVELRAQQLGLNAANVKSQSDQRVERDKRADRAQFTNELFQRAQFNLLVNKEVFNQKAAVEKIRNDRRKTTIQAVTAAKKPAPTSSKKK